MRFAKSVLLSLAAGLLVAMPVAAPAQQTATSDDASEESNDRRNEVVCRRVAPPTASRIGRRRLCQTQDVWDAAKREARESLDRAGVNRNND